MSIEIALQNILGDYPKLWDFIEGSKSSTNERSMKYARRYPLSIDALSNIIIFHKWVNFTTSIVAEVTGLPIPRNARRADTGPCPAILERLHWLEVSWLALESKNKNLSKTLSSEIVEWQYKIARRVGQTDTYTYDTAVICANCQGRTVMRIDDKYLCVNIVCKNPMTGEWRTWQISV